MTPSTQLDYFARFAYANPTAGWIAFNQSGAAGLAAAVLPDEGVQEIFGSTPLEAQPLFAAVSAPSGHTTACDGGHRLSGRWAYASGATIADWILLMNLCDAAAAQPGENAGARSNRPRAPLSRRHRSCIPASPETTSRWWGTTRWM